MENVNLEKAAAEAAAVTLAEMIAELKPCEAGPQDANGPHVGNVRAEGNVIALAEQSTHVTYAKTASDSIGEAPIGRALATIDVEIKRHTHAGFKSTLARLGMVLRDHELGARKIDVHALDKRTLAVLYTLFGYSPITLHPYDPDFAAHVAALGDTASNALKRDASSNGKKPIGFAWQERITNDPLRVYERFTEVVTDKPLDCNIGFANGTLLPNGKRLYIPDLDTKAGKGAERATLAERRKQLEDKFGPVNETVVSRSATPPEKAPEPGGHLHMEGPADVPVTFRKLMPGVDFPKQVVAPGSAIAGRRYEWGIAPWDAERAQAPAAMVIALKLPSKGWDADEIDDDAEASEADVKWAIDYLKNRAPEAVEGEDKHNIMLGVVRTVGDRIRSRTQVLDLVYDYWNEAKCTPPYEYDRLRKHVSTSTTSRKNAPGSKSVDVVFDDMSEDVAPPSDDLAKKIREANAEAKRRENERQGKAGHNSGAEPGAGHNAEPGAGHNSNGAADDDDDEYIPERKKLPAFMRGCMLNADKQPYQNLENTLWALRNAPAIKGVFAYDEMERAT